MFYGDFSVPNDELSGQIPPSPSRTFIIQGVGQLLNKCLKIFGVFYVVRNAGQSALVAAVLGTPAAQTQLLPALMRAYVGADFVVGLDVDTDNFDKFGMRSQIGESLMPASEMAQEWSCCVQPAWHRI